MRAIPLLLGCLLGLGAIANAVAAGTTAAGGNMSASSSYNCTNHTDERSASHDSSSASGDAFAIPRGASGSTGSSSHSHTSSSSSSSDEGSMHMSGGDAGGTSSHSSGLSWQSLLPGSIQ
jgi:hypothetical protein